MDGRTVGRTETLKFKSLLQYFYCLPYVSAASAASLAATNPSMKGRRFAPLAQRAAAAFGGRHPLSGPREAPPPSWMFVRALGRQQTQQKHMQMYAKHEHACTLYGRRLHPTEIMDLRNLQGVQTRLFGGGK